MINWFILFTKRNFKKLSFIFILLLIVGVTAAMTLTTQKDSSVMRIGYTCEKTPIGATKDIFNGFESSESIIKMCPYNSVDSAKEALSQAEIDSLWIFPDDIEKAVADYYMRSTDTIITVLDRSDSQATQLAREKLFCTVYPYLSYALFVDYMKSDSIPDGEKLTDEELRFYYEYKGIDSDIVNVVTVNANGDVTETKGNHLTTPLRGILSVIVMHSSLASAMYALEDTKRGLFAIFSPIKRIALYSASILSATLPSAVVAFASLSIAGLMENPLFEAFRMLLFVLMCTAMSLCFMGIFKTPKAFGTSLPLITVSSLLFSPVFMNINALPVIQGLFPTYHYLYSLSSSNHLIYMLVLTLIYSAIGIFGCRKS